MIRLIAAASVLPVAAIADVPHVMTDIAPIHSLTAQVMGDLGTPDLLLPPGADPHDFSLRPSDAASLGEADLVLWVGAGLTPWLSEPLATLAPQAMTLSLLETEGWEKQDIREDVGGHDDHEDQEDHDHEEHGDHDGHGDHDAHDKDEDHADHADDHKDHDEHAHDHGDFDPHGWLDPSVARVWVVEIAAQLSAKDPENAGIYASNAEDAIARLNTLETDLAAKLDGLGDRAYVLPHDGYQYFEARFGLTASAAIAGIDARDPGPAQVAELRSEMAENNVVCVFSDSNIGERWATLITEGSDANTVQIDGVGRGLEAGPDLYAALVTRLAEDFAACLGADM